MLYIKEDIESNKQGNLIWVEILALKSYLNVWVYTPDQTLEADLEMDKEIREMTILDVIILGYFS